jgi:hypothetical protein
MRKLTLMACAMTLAAFFLIPGAQRASAGVTPAASAAEANAVRNTEITKVQWRHGWGWHGGGWRGPGWHGGWRPGWHWRPGWGWGPWPLVPGPSYYDYGPYPYHYEPAPYYAPRPYAPPVYEPPLK